MTACSACGLPVDGQSADCPAASDHPKAMTLEEVVDGYLQLALLHPENEPKTQRAQRENQAMIVGYNRAQETLREILRRHGATADVRALSEVRSEKQQRPMKVGDQNLWVM